MSKDQPEIEKPKKVKVPSFEDQAAQLFNGLEPMYKSKYGGVYRAVPMTLFTFNEMRGEQHLEYDGEGFLIEIRPNQYKWLTKQLFELGRF